MNFVQKLVAILVIVATVVDSFSINEILLSKIEKFRLRMPCGIADGPVLAPYKLDYLDLESISSDQIETKGYFRNLQVNHLNEFVVETLNLNLFQMRIDFSVSLPQFNAIGDYELHSTVSNTFKFYGHGQFDVKLMDIKLSGFVQLSLKSGKLNLSKFNSVFTLSDIHTNITGILDGNESTDALYNQMLEQLVLEYVKVYEEDITNILHETVPAMINPYLNELTLSDIINGDDDMDKPCIVNRS